MTLIPAKTRDGRDILVDPRDVDPEEIERLVFHVGDQRYVLERPHILAAFEAFRAALLPEEPVPEEPDDG